MRLLMPLAWATLEPQPVQRSFSRCHEPSAKRTIVEGRINLCLDGLTGRLDGRGDVEEEVDRLVSYCACAGACDSARNAQIKTDCDGYAKPPAGDVRGSASFNPIVVECGRWARPRGLNAHQAGALVRR